MRLTIAQPFPPYECIVWEVKKNEPDGWQKAWEVTKNGEHMAWFRWYDSAIHWMQEQADRSLLRG